MALFDYKPYLDRFPDYQYRDIVREIRDYGVPSNSAHEESSITILAPPPMKFDLSNGAPLITERSFNGIWKSSVGEIFAFINGVRTLDGLREFGVSDRFWAPWVTEKKCAKRGLPPGDLGPGSYGAAFHGFPTLEGPFNQIQHVIEQIIELPDLRSHRVCNWIPQYQIRGKGKQQKVVVTPCHGDLYFRILQGKLHLVMVQHKADVPIGVPSNMIQYAALLMAAAHVTGYPVGEFIHILVDAHIYIDATIENEDGSTVSEMEAVDVMLSREPRPFPTLTLSPDAPRDIFKIRTEHFTLTDYHPHPVIKGIATAI